MMANRPGCRDAMQFPYDRNAGRENGMRALAAAVGANNDRIGMHTTVLQASVSSRVALYA